MTASDLKRMSKRALIRFAIGLESALAHALDCKDEACQRCAMLRDARRGDGDDT